jgi:methylsterol monooxygenase
MTTILSQHSTNLLNNTLQSLFNTTLDATTPYQATVKASDYVLHHLPIMNTIESMNTTLGMTLGDYHPQSLFQLLYTAFTNSFSAYSICVWWSFTFQVVFYFCLSFPSFIFDFLPFLQRYKIQANRMVSWEEQKKVLKTVLFSKIAMILPTAVIGYSVLHAYHMDIPYSYESMPAWYILTIRVIASLWIEDTWHYFMHRLMHHPRLYGYVHKVHHQYPAPFAFAAEYAHPLETFVLGVGFFIPMILFFDHIFYFWLWLYVRMAETADVHSGYDIPLLSFLNPLHLLPFYGGVQFHDFHHKNFVGNYASTFTFWDWFFGTDSDYKKARTKTKASKPVTLLKKEE